MSTDNILYECEMGVIIWKNPILYLNIVKISLDDDCHIKFRGALEKIYQKFSNKKIKFAQIYNALEIDIPSLSFGIMKLVKDFSKFLKNQEKIITHNCYAVAIILEANYRKIINTCLKFNGNKRPVKIIKNLKEAKNWIKYHIRADDFSNKINHDEI